MTSGNFSVLGCGNRTEAVQIVVQQLRDSLDIAIKTPSSSIVYSKFFKGASPAVVHGLLSGIAIKLDNGQPWHTKIFCANLDLPRLTPHGKICRDHSVYSTASPRYQYVSLCQEIFRLKERPDATDCAGSLAQGLMPSGQTLARTLLTILLHQLVDIYLVSMPGLKPLKPRVFGLDAVIGLSASQSVGNPANYVFYVASTSLLCQRGPGNVRY